MLGYTTLWFIINYNWIHISDWRHFSDFHISQGSVAPWLRHGGIFKHEFVANLLPSPSVKKCENRFIIGEVMGKSLTHGVVPNSHRPPDTTRQSCLCRVWRGGVNWTIAINVFRLQIFCRRQSWVDGNPIHTIGWRRGVVISGVRQCTKLTHVGPGYNWDGWPSSGGYTITGCNQPTRSTQPCIPPG